MPPERDFLFARRKRVRFVSFSDQLMVLEDFTYKVLVVISGQTGVALKIALKC